MALLENLIFLFALLLAEHLIQINAKTGTVITLDEISCFVNPAYVKPPNCSVDNTISPSRVNVDFQMQREVKSMRYEVTIIATINNKNRTLMHVKNKDACAFLQGRVTAILKNLKNIIDSIGTLPKKCPIPKDFRFLFKNITIDSDMLPPIMLSTDFYISTRNKAGKDFVFFIEDHIEDDCKEVQCPLSELECPTDSELKSSADDDFEHDEDDEGETNPFDRLADEGLIEELFSSSLLPSSTSPPHVLQKRSLQHRRREAIKIVPGDYRSFEPEFFKYHNHHQPHRKWKRDLVMLAQPHHSDAEIKKCCPEFQCVCGACPNVPKCDEGHVAIVVEQGHGLPGSCCSKYECVPEIECSTVSQPKTSYWRSECLKCDCFAGQELCQQLCEINQEQSPMNCFSGYLNMPKMNGETWLEDDDCKECKCVDGNTRCQESYCKPLDCENPIKIDGICCKVCPKVSSTSTTTTTTSTSSTTTSTSSTSSPTSKTSTSTSTSSTSGAVPAHEIPMTPTTSPTQQPEETSSSSTTPAPVTTISTEIHKTSTELTDIISTHREIGDLLEEIDIIVVLILASAILVIFTIAIGLVYSQRQKKKKLMYSTIPSSESSQSSSITLA